MRLNSSIECEKEAHYEKDQGDDDEVGRNGNPSFYDGSIIFITGSRVGMHHRWRLQGDRGWEQYIRD